MKKYYALALMDQETVHPDTQVNGMPVHKCIEVYRADQMDAYLRLLGVTAQVLQIETRNLALSDGAREFLQKIADFADNTGEGQ